MPEPPTRVLIYRLGSLGDTVVALPALHRVAEAFPHAERILLTNHPGNAKAPPAAAILEHTGLVHRYLRYPAGTRSPWTLLRLWLRILRLRPQVLVYLAAARGTANARRDARFFRLCGIRTQVGVPLTDELQRNLPTLGIAVEPEYRRLLRTLAPLNLTSENWDLHLTPDDHAAAEAALAPTVGRPVLAVSVGTKVQAKDWTEANWTALLSMLAPLYPGHALVLLGAAGEAQTSAASASEWSTPALNLCGLLTPRQSAAVLARAQLFLGHDSGPMHLAATVGTPAVALFAARRPPGMWFPAGPRPELHRPIYHPVDCLNCNLETCIDQRKKCLLSITPEEVLTQVLQALPVQTLP